MRTAKDIGTFLVALVATGCTGDASSPEQTPPLPAAFELVGSAQHTEDGWTVHCVIDATISGTSEIENDWTGTLVGHVVRTIVRPDGSAWEFDALVASSTFDVVTGPDGMVAVPLGGDQPPDAVAFWKAISPLHGEESSPWSYAGPWTCRGLDPAFDPRPGLVASGTWQLAPAVVRDDARGT
jgi:hypothetical protein